jgi:rSAM/selenodomain-associated transferase 1
VTSRPSDLFLILARAPVAGRTKTRLGATIGMERAARLYRAFLADLAARFAPTARYDLGWAFTPADTDFAAVLAGLGCPPPAAVRFVPQHGDDLGQRQANLLRWGRDHGYARTVLIASDSPQLPAALPEAAFAALAGHDLVLGRVLDGGYYLIGLAGSHEAVLAGVPMGTTRAADALLARAAALGLRAAELPPTFDVDVAADLALLREALAPLGGNAPATWAALRSLGLGAGLDAAVPLRRRRGGRRPSPPAPLPRGSAAG